MDGDTGRRGGHNRVTQDRDVGSGLAFCFPLSPRRGIFDSSPAGSPPWGAGGIAMEGFQFI